MTDFTQRMQLKEKAAEDIYFAQQDRKLIKALHDKQAKLTADDKTQLNEVDPSQQNTPDQH